MSLERVPYSNRVLEGSDFFTRRNLVIGEEGAAAREKGKKSSFFSSSQGKGLSFLHFGEKGRSGKRE